jgi:broad specificity phosphatase PhoE
MQARAVECVREHATKASSVFAICSHGDVIKSIIADAIGLGLDKFQSIDVQPASITVIQYLANGNARLIMQNFPIGEKPFSSLSLESQETLGGGDVRA